MKIEILRPGVLAVARVAIACACSNFPCNAPARDYKLSDKGL